jgi:hypothetical protein
MDCAKIVRLDVCRFGVCVALGLLAAGAAGAAQTPTASSACSQPQRQTISYVNLPGNPFAAVSTPDGCCVFVSLEAEDQYSHPGIAVLRRKNGKTELVRVELVHGNLAGMTLTHDNQLLIIANGEGVAVIDRARLISGQEHANIPSV